MPAARVRDVDTSTGLPKRSWTAPAVALRMPAPAVAAAAAAAAAGGCSGWALRGEEHDICGVASSATATAAITLCTCAVQMMHAYRGRGCIIMIAGASAVRV